MLITASVTQEDIDKDLHSCRLCPVSQALRRVLLPAYQAWTTGETVKIFPIDDTWRTPLWVGTAPREVMTFVYDYDSKKTVKPFSFEMEVPDQYLKKESSDAGTS